MGASSYLNVLFERRGLPDNAADSRRLWRAVYVELLTIARWALTAAPASGLAHTGLERVGIYRTTSVDHHFGPGVSCGNDLLIGRR